MIILISLLCVVLSFIAVRRFPSLAPLLFAGWLIVLAYSAFLSRVPTYSTKIILDPFRALELFWKYHNVQAMWKYQYLEGIGLNILLFIPCGFLLPILSKRVSGWREMLIFGFLLSLTIEVLQRITLLGSFDVADLINNTIGSLMGWYLLKLGEELH